MDNAFGLGDEDFWKNPWKNLSDLSWEIVGKEISEIVIGAPSKVSLAHHDTLPLLIFICTENKTFAKSNFYQDTSFIVENVKSKKKTLKYIDDRERLPHSSNEKVSQGFSGSEHKVDMFAQGLEMKSGDYKIRVKFGKMLSNVVHVKITN